MAEHTSFEKTALKQDDPNAADRKKAHIDLALQSQSGELDSRF
jgi:hypothetical protein